MARLFPLSRKRVETGTDPFWISYADLMTALVMLFLVVMSISMIAVAARSAEEKRLLQVEKKLLDMEKKDRESVKRIRDEEVSGFLLQLEERAKQGGLDIDIDFVNQTISFGEKVRFAHDSTYLSEKARESLRDFVPLLLEVRNNEFGKRWLKRIHIEGYTDETGTYLYNVNLSLRRAQAVLCALLAGNLDEHLVRQFRELLIIDGATVTGIKSSREASRRVEVRLEFRQVGDLEKSLPVPAMEIGKCAIDLEAGKIEEGGKPDAPVKEPHKPAKGEHKPS